MRLSFPVLPFVDQGSSANRAPREQDKRYWKKRFQPKQLRLHLSGILLGGLSVFLATNSFASNKLQFFTLQQQQLWLQVNQLSQTTRAKPLNLWATYYHIYRASSVLAGEPLLNQNGQPLGPELSHRDWCQAALQGTVQVFHASRVTTYNFGGRGASPQTDCSPYFPSLSRDVIARVNRVRFVASSAPYGYGTEKLRLVPYRTIAVDRTQIPIGSVIFIPAARGQVVTLPSGDRVYHDGFFFAGDVGSAIQGNHIDVFLGTSSQNPFPFITSKASKPFQAFLIQDPEITSALAFLHQNVGDSNRSQ